MFDLSFLRSRVLISAAILSTCAIVHAEPASMAGPITGPGPMHTSLQAVPAGTNLSDFGYEATEYLVKGTAAGEPYATRVLVRAPKDVSKFSGIVVAEPMHSTGNSWMFYFARIHVMTRGHASVEIASQKEPTETTVVATNPQRYAGIKIVSNPQSNEILAQVGELLKANQANGPLPGMTVRNVILMGTSQSAATVRGYMAATHAARRLPNGGPIYDGFLPTSTGGPGKVPAVDVPTIQVAAQTEVHVDAASGNDYRREDGDEPGNQFRLYELAGVSHNDTRENPIYKQPGFCDLPLSTFPMGAMDAVTLHHLIQWVDKGTVPPRASRILMDGNESNDGSPLALDQYGNAQGGVRNPYVDVPAAKLGIPNKVANPQYGELNQLFCSIAGYVEPMSNTQLKQLYGSAIGYRSKVEASLVQLYTDGWFLPEYATQVHADMRKIRID